MAIKKSLESLDKDFRKLFERYIEFDKQLMTYRGVEINNENVEKINSIVIGMQDVYAELHESLIWINGWSKNAALLVSEHQKFMDDIKLAGGVPDKKEEKVTEAEA